MWSWLSWLCDYLLCKKKVGGRGKFDLLVAIHATAVVAQKAVEAASFEFNVFILLLLVFFIFSFDVNQNCKDCTCLVGSGGWRCCIIWIGTCNLYFAFLLSFLTYIWCVRNEHISSFLQLRVTNSNPNLMSLVVAKFYWPY